ncbi:lytic transglycosylase domain-containing protein [Defluviimonas sp. WL0050]|uniref:Lytic transglycosylase domain-containing protein n=1 Tax=Albidovulum litorale TaxID=2984134 RepID=A0ABT2ZRR1_9RHOB|nr:lytic transglycosylase domain-containing protein [Defluviimonas sp. WL0050]MCV2873846.1 lytic transglycosylase domain-containing protein [Defluviimonas sp. WL0050]
MQIHSRRAALALLIAGLAACGRREPRGRRHAGTAQVNRLITKYARIYDMPEDLMHRVVERESGYNPAARNGPYFGLMQIHPQTAATMGYRGAPEGLLDAETNLKYAGKYLRGAWLVSRGNRDRAVMWYSKGYYYEAKRMGLLRETGLRS